jgi:hypothetical protein
VLRLCQRYDYNRAPVGRRAREGGHR